MFWHWCFNLAAIASAALVLYFAIRFLYRREILKEVISTVALMFAILIPQQIDSQAREVQKLGTCVNTILELRRNLLSYYRLNVDEFGTIIDPGASNNSASDLRIQLQNAKDSTYTLCNGIGSPGAPVLDSSSSPWKEAPISATAGWNKSNVSDLYTWSTDALGRITQIQPKPMHFPGTNIPIFPHLDW